MMTSSFRKISPVIFCAVASLAAGVVGGTTTVHGLSANSYGSSDSYRSIVRDRSPSPSEATGSIKPQQTAYDDCQGCSDLDRGYHWAALQRIASIADCPVDSWNFRRGCVAYMRDTGGV